MVIPRPDAPVARPIPVVFFGSPEFAVPTLEALAGDARFAVRLAVTQPPRPVGRGRHVQRSAVHAAADARGLPVFAPERLRGDAVLAQLSEAEPSLFVVAAYGKILRPDILAIPDRGTLNVHASLLPAYRGASPIHAAILDGVRTSGVTIMLMDVGLDTGPILAQQLVAVPPEATTASLSPLLADVGARLLAETAVRWVDGEIVPSSQDEAQASVTHLIKKDDGSVNWREPAARLARMERAYRPWPGVFTMLGKKRLLLHDLHAAPTTSGDAPGTVIAVDDDGLRVRTGDGDLIIGRVQPEGRPAMSGPAFANGHRGLIGTRLGGGARDSTP